PTPYSAGAAGASVPAPSSTATMMRLRMAHPAVGAHAPHLDPVVVIETVRPLRHPAHSNQLLPRRLDIPGVVGAPRSKRGRATVPAPRQLKAGECFRKRWL